jgi:hypothetical protein
MRGVISDGLMAPLRVVEMTPCTKAPLRWWGRADLRSRCSLHSAPVVLVRVLAQRRRHEDREQTFTKSDVYRRDSLGIPNHKTGAGPLQRVTVPPVCANFRRLVLG